VTFQNFDEPIIVEILGNLDSPNFLNSEKSFNEDEFREYLTEAFSKSINSIRDTKLKEEIREISIKSILND
jgi:hypothetical protein